MDAQSFGEVLCGLRGQVVTVVNQQSYIPTLTGFKVDVESYKAKVVSCDNGILRILIDYLKDPRRKIKEKAYQIIPIEQIKQVMISKTERLVTI